MGDDERESKNDSSVPDSEKTPKKVPPHRKIILATEAFLRDLECLREMFDTVVPVLEQQDSSRKKRLEEIAKYLATIEENTLEDLKNDRVKFITEVEDLLDTLPRLDRANSMFRQNTIVILVSTYDWFLGKIFSLILHAHPERLKSPDKALSYEEILQLPSIEAALDKFISKEVDQLLRLSAAEKIAYLDKQLKLGLKESITCWPSFIELTERRHLFAHTGGLVTQQYLQICAKHGVKVDEKVHEGISMDISPQYFKKAYRCSFELGVRIGQMVLRKIYPDSLKEADRSLSNTSFKLLQNEDWELANIILHFALSIPKKQISSEAVYRVYIINKCIALKWLGHQDKMLALLSSIDWSATSTRFLLPVAVLKEEYDEAERIMSAMNGHDQINENCFRTWPVFRDFRKTEHFNRAFRKVYGKDYQPSIAASVEEVPLEDFQDT